MTASTSNSIGASSEKRSIVYRKASLPTSSSRSSTVAMSPARLLILAGWPARTRLTSWLMRNSAVSSGSPKARTTARIRGT